MFMKAPDCDPAFTAAFFVWISVTLSVLLLLTTCLLLLLSTVGVQKWLCSALVFFAQSPHSSAIFMLKQCCLFLRIIKMLGFTCVSHLVNVQERCAYSSFLCFVCLYLIGKKFPNI